MRWSGSGGSTARSSGPARGRRSPRSKRSPRRDSPPPPCSGPPPPWRTCGRSSGHEQSGRGPAIRRGRPRPPGAALARGARSERRDPRSLPGPAGPGPRAAGRPARHGRDAPGPRDEPGARPGVPPDPVPPGPHALRHHGRESPGGDGWLRLPRRTDLRRPGARRRDQPGPRQDPGGAARGDAGAKRHRGRHGPPVERHVHGLRHPEPDRVRGDLSPPRGGARPVPPQEQPRLPGSADRGRRAPSGPGGVRRRGARELRDPPGAGPRVAHGAAARRVRVEPSLVGYITSLVRATRDAPALTLGASPRASVALLKLSQAAALLDGRDFVIPDDAKGLAVAVLRHRVMVAPELELEGVTADTALRSLLERVAAPQT